MSSEKLRRVIGPVGLLFICVGSIIGSGWLFGPLYAAKAAGPASLLAWILGAMAMFTIAFVYAELGAALPWTGGLARYPRLTHGYLTGLVFSAIAWIGFVAVAPIEVQAVIEYAADYIPVLTHVVKGEIELTGLGMLLAAGLLFVFCLINIYGVKFFVQTNTLIVWWKLLVPAATVLIFLSVKFEASNFTHHGGFFPLGWKGVFTAISTSGVIMAYSGFRAAIVMAGESKNPQRDIPFALIGSIALCLIIFLGIQIAFIGALNPESLQNGWSQLSFKGVSGPIASIAILIGVSWWAKILFIDALISPSGTALIYTGVPARLTYAMAEKDFFPSVFLKLNKRGVPYAGILINFVIGLILLLPFPGWEKMVGFISAAFALSFCSGAIVLLSLRKQKPDLKRPYKMPAPNILATSAFIISNYIVYWTGWETNSKLFLIILTLVAVLVVYNRIRLGERMTFHLYSGLWIILLIVGQLCLSYLGSFGGGRGWLPFGWDLLVVGLFSVFVLWLSLRSRLKTEQMEQIEINL